MQQSSHSLSNMSDRSFRRRAPATNQKSRPPKPTPLPSRRTTTTTRRSKTASKPIKILHRCHSGDNTNYFETQIPTTDALLLRLQTCMDFFTPPFGSPTPSPSPRYYDIYGKDAKVVVAVTVEGSPGPVKTMVKLGWTVEETIRVVVDKYKEEGRTPNLDHDAASSFQLHYSCFSLHNLDKKQAIGEFGSRSFYLRKSSSNESRINSDGLTPPTASSSSSSSSSFFSSFVMLIPQISMRATTATPAIASPPLIISLDFIARKLQKLIRRMLKLWKLLGCVQCE